MAIDKVLSSSIANGAVTAALISNTANLVVSSLTANVISITTISGSANVTGDMTVGGNLTISGTTTYVNTTDLNIGDAIISLNADLAANVSPTEDAGISINRGASTNAQFKWIESTDNWSIGNTTVSGVLTSNDHVITGTANVSTGINVGANVNLSTSQINVGNSTVNTVISATSLTTTSNTVSLGTAAYFVANGNVGVGTSSPAYKLDVNGDIKVANAIRYFVGATQYGVTFANAGAVGTEAYQNTYIFWGTGSGASATERMRLDASGNLLIGGTSNARSARLISENAAGQQLGIRYTSVATWYQNVLSSGDFTIDRDGSEYLRIVSATGNLGIGTTTPATKLHVYQRSDAGAAPGTPAITIEHQDINAVGTGGSAGGVLSFVNIQRDNTAWANNSIWGRINFSPSQPTGGTAQLGASILAAADGAIGGLQSASYLAFYTSDYSNGGNTGEKMRISAGGNLGIGVTSPSWKLEVEGNQESLASFRPSSNTSAGYARFINGGGTFYIGIESSNGTRISGSGLAYAASMTTEGNTALTFGTNNTNRMTIGSTGNVGIGTTSPVTRLSINTSTQNSEAATIGGIDYGGTKRGLSIRTYQNNGGDDCGVEFNAAPSNSGYGAFKFNAASTTLATLNTSGSLTLAGSIFPAVAYSYSIDTSSWSANTFYTIVPTGHLSNYTTYWVTVRWDHGGGGGPFIMATAFMFSVVNTNGTGTDNTFTPLTSSHTGGGGVLSFRCLAGSGSTTGLQASANSIVPGTMTVYLYRFV